VRIGTLSPELSRAVDDLEDAFPGRLAIESQDATGLVVRLHSVALAERWSARVGELWFVVPYNYPDAPVYPYYVVGVVLSGGAVPALQTVVWRGMTAVQVSLRQTAWDPSRDTVVGCVMQTTSWLRRT
jgi:hypothetical protein